MNELRKLISLVYVTEEQAASNPDTHSGGVGCRLYLTFLEVL